MQVFTTVAVPQRTFVQKMFGKWPDGYAFAVLNNLLATKPVKEILLEDVLELCRSTGTDLYAAHAAELRELYKAYIRKCLTDHKVSDEEIGDLRHLKALLVLNDNDIQAVHDDLASEIYRTHTKEAVSDGRLTQTEEEELEHLTHELMLSQEVAKKISAEIRTEFVQNYLKQATSDKRLSDDEQQELDAICKSLSATMQYDELTQAVLDKYRLLWCIENGNLPVVSVSIHLQRDERCYLEVPAMWYENRTVTRSIRYGGPAVSIKIVKGLYYRAGGYSYEKAASEELKLIDSGTLYVTNKRIIFVGAVRNTNIRLEKVLSLTPYKDGVEVVKDAGRNPLFVTDTQAELLFMILTRVIEDRRRIG